LGHSRRFRDVGGMSALPAKLTVTADIEWRSPNNKADPKPIAIFHSFSKEQPGHLFLVYFRLAGRTSELARISRFLSVTRFDLL
jgi:hypothetical protein